MQTWRRATTCRRPRPARYGRCSCSSTPSTFTTRSNGWASGSAAPAPPAGPPPPPQVGGRGARRVAGGLARARKLRDALRALVLANNGIALDPAALDLVNRELESVSLQLDRSGHLAFAANGAAMT